jgi:hypothetical protein
MTTPTNSENFIEQLHARRVERERRERRAAVLIVAFAVSVFVVLWVSGGR